MLVRAAQEVRMSAKRVPVHCIPKLKKKKNNLNKRSLNKAKPMWGFFVLFCFVVFFDRYFTEVHGI